MTPSQDAREALTEWLEYQIEHGCAPDGYAIEMTEEYAMGRRSAFVAVKTTIETMPEAHLRTPATDTETMRLLRDARIDLTIARNRLQSCTVAAIAAGMHREQYEWGEWTDEASCAVTRIDAALAKGGAS